MAQNSPREPKTRRWTRRRDEILRVAEEVFAEIGFAAATLEEVARRLELRRPALAYYFDDKEALYDSVFAEILEALGERLSSAFAEEDPLAAIEATTSIWIDFLSERPDAGRVLLRQMVEALPPRSNRTHVLFESMTGQLREVIARGEAQGRFKPIDAGHYGVMIAGTSLLWVSARDALRRAYGFDSTAPEHIESLRHRLVQLTRQLLEVAPTEWRFQRRVRNADERATLAMTFTTEQEPV